MTQMNPNFQAATVSSKFNNICARFDSLLAQPNNEELAAIREQLNKDLKAYKEQGILTVAFVGQYSAGKSTIISALTGRRDIYIDADIATEKTASYDWNGIKIIDTPGLFTDHEDHDERTYEAIAKADLLVFSLTYMLFDSVTVTNFKKLAYEKGYHWKMMLVINKMSCEAGEDEQKIANYCSSLAEALKPDSLDEFPVCFIDAKDYCEGVDENTEFLIEDSRFHTFIDALNNFVDRRGSLAQFDTPVRIALNHVDEAALAFSRDSNQDSAYLEILTRLSRIVHKKRNRLQTQVQSIALEMSSVVAQEGTILAEAVGVGSKEEFEKLNKKAEIKVQEHYEEAENKLQNVINKAVEEIRQEVKEVFESNLVQEFVSTFNRSTSWENRDFIKTASEEELLHSIDVVSGGLNQGILTVGRMPIQVALLTKIGDTAGVQLTNFATRGFIKTASGEGFLRSIDVAGSGLHQGILSVGKFVGFKFKPWQAVNIAKNIGNAAKYLGPALGVVSVGADCVQMQQEHEREQEMSKIRRDITKQFQEIAKGLENQFEVQLSEFEGQVYGEIEKQIAKARQQEENAIAASNSWVKELAEIRKEFELILRYITKATAS